MKESKTKQLRLHQVAWDEVLCRFFKLQRTSTHQEGIQGRNQQDRVLGIFLLWWQARAERRAMSAEDYGRGKGKGSKDAWGLSKAKEGEGCWKKGKVRGCDTLSEQLPYVGHHRMGW